MTREETEKYVEEREFAEYLTQGMSPVDVIDICHTDFESRICENCKFRNDNRKCPMADPEAMEDKNSCYNWFESND